jgi:hypothetical protein
MPIKLRIISFLLLILWLFAAREATMAQALSPPETFPRIAGMNIGGGHNFQDPSYQSGLAKYDLAVLSFWNGWNFGGLSIREAVQAIKAINPDIILAKYTNASESADQPTGAKSDIYAKVSSEEGPGGSNPDWWARDEDGNYISSWPGNYSINVTEFVKPDVNGDRFPEWFAQRNYNLFFRDIPEFDMVYMDVYRVIPRETADWNGDGTNDDLSDATVRTWYRQGMQAYSGAFRALLGKPIIVNATTWVYTRPYDGPWPEYSGKIEGGFIEHAMGKNWSFETWGNWEELMDRYHLLFNDLADPKFVMFDIVNEERGGIGVHQFMRYGLASALMDNGYFSFSESSAYGTASWFDEYDLAGTSNSKWLGKALQPPQTDPWEQGVYRRNFQGGVALVNPKGNGQQTVTMEAGFKRISGTQDPAVNNGEPVTSITLEERDGILLVREGGMSLDMVPVGNGVLFSVYANPFSSSVFFYYTLSMAQHIRLCLYNPAGRLLRKIVDGKETAGGHTVTWDIRDEQGRKPAAGIYTVQLTTEKAKLQERFILMRQPGL